VRHEGGRLLYARGERPEALQFLLDGTVRVAGEKGGTTELKGPLALAFEEILEGHPMRTGVQATEPVITLSLTTEEFLKLLSENVEIAQGIFRLLLDTRCAPSWRSVVHSRLTPELEKRLADGVQAIDRLLLFQSSPLLARATATELLRLAGIARGEPLKAGATLFEPGNAAAIHIVLQGAVQLEVEGQAPDTAMAGDVLGMYETFGGRYMAGRATVTQDGTALRIDRGDLFELLADHVVLLQGIFSALLHTRGLLPQPPSGPAEPEPITPAA
jgi:CRP-like cAMP-binding protein